MPVHMAGTHFSSPSPGRSEVDGAADPLSCLPDRVPALCQVQGVHRMRAALFGAELIL